MRNNRKILHCTDGPALSSDWENLYYLNGVFVTEEIVMTPAEKLEPVIILKEENAEVRREIVRKIGVERICENLKAKCIDTENDYELLLLDLQDGRNRPYLKMKNSSIGIYHIEGVHPNCKTVKEALEWRNKSKSMPVVLT